MINEHMGNPRFPLTSPHCPKQLITRPLEWIVLQFTITQREEFLFFMKSAEHIKIFRPSFTFCRPFPHLSLTEILIGQNDHFHSQSVFL